LSAKALAQTGNLFFWQYCGLGAISTVLSCTIMSLIQVSVGCHLPSTTVPPEIWERVLRFATLVPDTLKEIATHTREECDDIRSMTPYEMQWHRDCIVSDSQG